MERTCSDTHVHIAGTKIIRVHPELPNDEIAETIRAHTPIGAERQLSSDQTPLEIETILSLLAAKNRSYNGKRGNSEREKCLSNWLVGLGIKPVLADTLSHGEKVTSDKLYFFPNIKNHSTLASNALAIAKEFDKRKVSKTEINVNKVNNLSEQDVNTMINQLLAKPGLTEDQKSMLLMLRVMIKPYFAKDESNQGKIVYLADYQKK